MKNLMSVESANSATTTCEIAEGVSVAINLADQSSLDSYKNFCYKLKRINSIEELSEDDKLKLFILSRIMTTSNLEKFLDTKREITIPNESGSLNLKSLRKYDSLSIKGTGQESWKRDNRVSTPSQYVLNLLLDDQKIDTY